MRRHDGDHRARFLTFSTYERLPLLANPGIRDRVLAHLDSTHTRDSFRLFAWVVMPEHVHLLIHPSQTTASASLSSIKRAVAREVVAR